jgi:hypothetical protein
LTCCCWACLATNIMTAECKARIPARYPGTPLDGAAFGRLLLNKEMHCRCGSGPPPAPTKVRNLLEADTIQPTVLLKVVLVHQDAATSAGLGFWLHSQTASPLPSPIGPLSPPLPPQDSNEVYVGVGGGWGVRYPNDQRWHKQQPVTV